MKREMVKRVCLFCGAKTGNSNIIEQEIKELCRELIENGYSLIYGGGKSGLMGVIANIFLEHKKEVIGIRPKKLIIDEDAHNALDKLIVVEDMFERKKKMIEMADLFIALPGGVGTIDEIMDVYTQRKIGFNDKKCAVLNSEGYYNHFQEQLKTMVKFGFLYQEDLDKLIIESNPKKLIPRIC